MTNAAGEPTYFVRDNGAGFDMAYVDRLFGPFQRLHLAQRVSRDRHRARHGAADHPPPWRPGVGRGLVGQGATFHFTIGRLRA